MPSLSSVLKADSVKLNGGVLRLPAYFHAAGSAEPKSQTAVPEAPGAQVLHDAQAEAAEIVAAARREREEILAAAGQECEELRKKAEMQVLELEEGAKQRGYDTGYLEGMAAGQREGSRMQREAEELLAETRRIRSEMLEAVEPQVVELAVCIAEKLVSRQLSEEPETVVSMVRELLQQVKESGDILIRLHPDDVPLCRDKAAELQAELREHSSLSFLADGAVARGHCRVETSGAAIECMLDERFAKLRETLLDVTSNE
ncbi:FliH/SctL family protein [Dethiobacter alkaliphilus]|uniref:Flagellar assembly protein FliH n=1 Tax=Dethiobacter alkaliphilus AHT 1 TaxID=555088 RepID=C0GJI0_DETAL|nr:FliH/SctL family protein [Dethiobacter alkaliphilus]EEG76527.1 flagellar assembly protein FliH [Dethiobacter alkaliphilus AHT 1]